jgi:hypothetical protein
MKTFKQFVENKEEIIQLGKEHELDYSKLGFPPWAKTNAGQYFLNTDGKIMYTIQGQKGIMNFDMFEPIYHKHFAKDITPQMAHVLTNKYAKQMTSSVDDQPKFGAKSPDMYQGHGTTMISQDGETTYKSPNTKGIYSQGSFENSPQHQELMNKIYK